MTRYFLVFSAFLFFCRPAALLNQKTKKNNNNELKITENKKKSGKAAVGFFCTRTQP